LQQFGPSILRRIRLLALFAAIGLLTRLVLLTVPIVNIDEASYIVGSWELLSGKLPYVAFADNKPPLVYVYYAFAQVLFGHGMLSVRLLTSLCTIPLTAYGVSAFFDHDRRGLVGGLLFLVYSAAFRAHDMIAVNCEILMLLPLSWAIVLVRRPEFATVSARLAGAGVLVGVATLVKYQAASWLAAIALPAAIIWWRRDGARGALKPVTTVLAGFAMPLAVTYLLFAALGGATGFIYWNVTHNAQYAANPMSLVDILVRGGSYMGPFVLVTAPLWLASAWFMTTEHPSYQRLLFAGLLVCSLCSVLVGFRFFPHYFIQFYVPLAMAAAPGMATLLTRPLSRAGWLLACYSVAVLAGFTASSANGYLAHDDVLMETKPVFQSVSVRLHADTCFGTGPLFVWGNSAPLFYFHSTLSPASRFFFPESPLVGFIAGNTPATIARAVGGASGTGPEWDWLIGDLVSNRPTYILDTASADLDNWRYFPLENAARLAAMVDESYARLDSVDGVVIYRLRACTAPAPVASADAARSPGIIR
jgi:4-amino-4-deoxy-L-arabinose transferase-like glycosyltransferase